MNASSSAAGESSDLTLEDLLKVICRVTTVSAAQFEALRQYYVKQHPIPRHWSQGRYGPSSIPTNLNALPTNRSVYQAVTKLRDGWEKTAEEYRSEAFPGREPYIQEEATRFTVMITFMLDPDSESNFPMGFRFKDESVFPVKWQPTQKFKDFFLAAFPMDVREAFSAADNLKSLKAWKLHKRLRIRFLPTNDLAEHLVYNPQARTLSVFHQIEWLKAQVRFVLDRKLDESAEMSFIHGTLPPQLLVETLYTIYYILFPIDTGIESLRFAQRLVGDSNLPFDRNLLIHDGLIYRVSADFKCVYWGRRLVALQALVEARPPSNSVVAWIERHTSERNALTVAIIALFLSVLVGTAQLIVSILAWKNPA